MARPFRFEPPTVPDGAVLRLAVQHELARRFDRRLTQLVAGAGFGKTTALIQAFQENELAPLGDDVWLACDEADADPDHFAGGLARVIGSEHEPGAAGIVSVLCEWAAGRSPTAVCFVFDDVHHLSEPSLALLDELVQQLPRNAGLVLASRWRPDLASVRLELIGEGVVIDEEALALDDEQVAAVLGGVPASGSSHHGGWPALVALARNGLGQRFVREEVLAQLDTDGREMLQRLVVLGEATATVLGAGDEGSSRQVALDRLPLVGRRQDRWRAHDLWSDLLGPVAADVERRVRQEASRTALAAGQPIEAVDLALPIDRTDAEIVDAALERALRNIDAVAPDVLRRWHRATRGNVEHSSSPVRELLQGLAVRLSDPFGDECVESIRSACEQFLDTEADPDLTIAALGALVLPYQSRREVAGLLWVFEALDRLAEHHRAAEPYRYLGQAVLAQALGDAAEVVRNAERMLEFPLPRELEAGALWLCAMGRMNLGVDSVEQATRCAALDVPMPGMGAIEMAARWRSGLIRGLLDDPPPVRDTDRDRFIHATWALPLAASTGDTAAAMRWREVIETTHADADEYQTAWTTAAPLASLAAAEGRDDEVREHVERIIGSVPTDGRGAYLRFLVVGLVYPFIRSEREWFTAQLDDPDLGPLFRRDITLASAAAEAADGDLGPVSELQFPATAGEMIPSVGVRFAPLLLAAAIGIGRSDVDDVLADLVDLLGDRARDGWRQLLDHAVPEIANGSRSIIESLPVRPPGRRSLALLGRAELRLDGAVVEHADWRRSRVQALLAYLTLHPDTNRETVMAAVWPEADAAAARRNLRTTLNLLHQVLEPGRRPGDAPYFVRSSGQRLRLVDDDGTGLFDVDVRRFVAYAAEGDELERSGTTSLSIEPRLAAIELYRGDLFPGCYDDWISDERDRLRSRYLATAVRTAELLVSVDRAGDAIDVVTPAIAIEPWSEAAHRALIAGHLARNDVAAARRSMETARQALDEMGGFAEVETEVLLRRLVRR